MIIIYISQRTFGTKSKIYHLSLIFRRIDPRGRPFPKLHRLLMLLSFLAPLKKRMRLFGSTLNDVKMGFALTLSLLPQQLSPHRAQRLDLTSVIPPFRPLLTPGLVAPVLGVCGRYHGSACRRLGACTCICRQFIGKAGHYYQGALANFQRTQRASR